MTSRRPEVTQKTLATRSAPPASILGIIKAMCIFYAGIKTEIKYFDSRSALPAPPVHQPSTQAQVRALLPTLPHPTNS